MMSNFKCDVVGTGRAAFKEAFGLFFYDVGEGDDAAKRTRTVIAYTLTKTKDGADALILHQLHTPECSKDVHPLPYRMNYEDSEAFVWGWLRQAKHGERPDCDGSIERDAWSLRSACGGQFVEISPEYSVYGK